MAESVANATPVSRRRPTVAAWEQQPGENDLWFARFLRYVALGPGRSVSLVAKGRRNAYPVPAHWPIQAKQHSWKTRAEAFDAAAKLAPELIAVFNASLAAVAKATANGEETALTAAVAAGGYQAPPVDEYEDEPDSSER